MFTPQFLIAKYTPDLRRSEPRNMGVIVWSNGAVFAKFAGESSSRRASITPPSYLRVSSRDAYRKWVRYWRELIARPVIRGQGGSIVDRSNPGFVDALLEKSKPQYRLVRGGEFLTAVTPQRIAEVANELFDELVVVGKDNAQSDHAAVARLLAKSCRKAIEESGLNVREGFWGSGFDWLCEVGSRKLPFHFDYAIHTGQRPLAVMDKVNLWKPEDVYSTAYEFRAMRQQYELPQKDCAALVYPTEADLASEVTQNLWAMLADIGTVIDMRDPIAAARRFRTLAA